MTTKDDRLDMLHHQLDTARQMLAHAESFETENPDCEWECVCATIEDAISSIQHDINGIDDWAKERYDDYAAGKADYERDLRMSEG